MNTDRPRLRGLLLAGALLLAFTNLPAQAGEPAQQCPNPGRMRSLCGQVGIASRNDVKGPNRMGKYEYQQTIYEAACVTVEELDDAPQELVAKKVQAAWEKYGKRVTCENRDTIGGANILKYGASVFLDSFMEDAVLGWHLDMNYYDEKDNGRTLLDWLDYELAGPLGPELRKKFEYYRKLVIKGGGKTRAELARQAGRQ